MSRPRIYKEDHRRYQLKEIPGIQRVFGKKRLSAQQAILVDTLKHHAHRPIRVGVARALFNQRLEQIAGMVSISRKSESVSPNAFASLLREVRDRLPDRISATGATKQRTIAWNV